MDKKIFILLPAYNEWEQIRSVIQDIQKNWYNNIIVVNDWSTDSTQEILKKSWIKHANHVVNRWAWAATQTWFELAIILWADIVVTMDADWQHYTEDLKKLIETLETKKVDVVIWSRFIQKQKMPIHRKLYNFVWNIVTWFFFWAWVTDSQSWLKAFNKKALSKIKIESNWYEFCSEIIQKIHKNNLSYTEIPISIKYTKYSQSKWQSLFNWFKTVWKLALHSLIN